MRSLLPFLGFLVIALFGTGCKKKTGDIDKNIFFEHHLNISYGDDPGQKMDLYIPRNRSVKRQGVFMMIHGGGWRGGDKSMLTSFTLSLMEKFPDYVFTNINYRLASESHYALPDQADDITNAIRFLEKKLNSSPKFILLGNSAGGHLSMLYTYKFDKDKKVKAVINIVGPSDIADPGFKNYEDYNFVENHLVNPKAIPSDISTNTFASPVNWIMKTSAPTLSFYGTNDRIIPLSQKKILDAALLKNNVIHTSYEFNGDHMDWLKEPHCTFLITKISEFLKQADKK